MKSLLVLLLAAVGSITANAQSYEYKCFSYYWNGYDGLKGTMKLSVDSKNATADVIDQSWDDNLGGALNDKYISKGKIKFLKFGYNLLVEEALVDGGRQLKDGSLGGLARVEGQAEGSFYQYKFICKSEQ